MTDNNNLKKAAAEQAVSYIESGMVIGLGTGSTAYYATIKVGELIKQGKLKDILAIPSSNVTEALAKELGIPLTTFKEHSRVNLTIDGADEVDKNLNLIKGGGGALLKEKILAQASDKFFVVVDESKISTYLGEKWRVPVEVIPFALDAVIAFLKNFSIDISIRNGKDGKVFVTDEGNYIIDVNFGIMNNPHEISLLLSSRAGIVEHGIFCNMATMAFVAYKDGVRKLER